MTFEQIINHPRFAEGMEWAAQSAESWSERDGKCMARWSGKTGLS
jgi:hypothetical protein